MKKFKTFLLLLLCFLSSATFFACEKTIKVDNILLNSYDVVLRPGEEFDLECEINPSEANNKEVEYFLTSGEFVELIYDENDNAKVKIRAKSDVFGTQITLLQAKTIDGSVQSDICKITVYTSKTKLLSPQNLMYDNVNQIIKWDKNDSASGYKLLIDVEGEEKAIEEICATNSCKIDNFYNKEISVKVQALGDGTIFENSDYSNETFKFIQLEEPTGLKNNNFIVMFNKVENAKSYNIFVFDSVLDSTPEYSFNVLNKSEQETINYNLEGVLNNAGKTYFVKVQAVPNDSADIVEYASTYNNYIKISKFSTPTIVDNELKFDYVSNTISWKNIPEASGYVVTRYCGSDAKAYNFVGETSQTNFLKIDTEEDSLLAGEYIYKLKIIGNGKEFLSSNEGEGLKIEKLSAPVMRVYDGIVVWDAKENIGAYKLRINGGNAFQISSEITSYSFNSTTQKTYNAGTYNLEIASVGNGKNTITSEYSSLSVIKLAKNELATIEENRYLTFKVNSVVTKIDVVITNEKSKINEIFSINNLTNKVDFKQATVDMQSQNYPAGTYRTYVTCYSEGYLTSDRSEILEFYKLPSTQKATFENGEIKYEKIANCAQVEVVVNSNRGQTTYKSSETDFKVSNITDFVAGEEYRVKLRYYPSERNYVISNYTEEVVFEKISNNTETLKVENAIINPISSTKPSVKYEFRAVGETEFEQISTLDSLKIEDDKIYELRFYYVGYQQGGKYYLDSDRSTSIEFKLKKGIEDLERVDDEVSFSTNGSVSYMLKFKCGSYSAETNVTSLSSYKLKTIGGQEKIYFSMNDYLSTIINQVDNFNRFSGEIKICVAFSGSVVENEVDRAKYNKTSSENLSNEISLEQELTEKIIDLDLVGNTVTFTSCGADSYQAKVYYTNKEITVSNLDALESYQCLDNSGGEVTFDLEEFIRAVFDTEYENITDVVEIKIIPVSSSIAFVRNLNLVSVKLYDESNSIYVNILQSPKNFKATKLIDLQDTSLTANGRLYLNELFFECGDNSELFELTYTNSLGEKNIKILSLDNLLVLHDSKMNKKVYRINTTFLTPDTYSFEIRSIKSSLKQKTNGKEVFYIDGFDKQTLSGITKISPVTDLEYSDGVVTIVDSSNNYSNSAYLLVKDGKIIYDDVLAAGQDFSYLVALASSGDMNNLTKAYTMISKFKEKSRTLPDNCTGTFTISAIKVALPDLLDIATGGEAIKSEECEAITLTRLETVKPVIRNGIIEWSAIIGAETYSIYEQTLVNGVKTFDFTSTPVAVINANETLKFDIYSHLNGAAGNYCYVILAKTTQENYLQSLSSKEISFEILETPKLEISGGKVVWTSSSNAVLYKLEVLFEGETFDEFILSKSIFEYDAKLKSDKMTYLESGNYEFRITALGASLDEDETTILKSLTTSAGNCLATKLETPKKISVEKGLIVMQIINGNTGVDYYNLKINGSNRKISSNFNLDGNKILFELEQQYGKGEYNLSFEAVGKGNYLTSNVSEEFVAQKLGETTEIYVLDGEIYWNEVEVENYLRDESSIVKYKLDLNREISIYSEITDSISFLISDKSESEVPSNIYTLSIKTLGDDGYYLNSNEARLVNVVKLGSIKNIRIENGTLCWTNPSKSDIAGLQPNTKVSPNGIELTLEKDGNKRQYVLEDGVTTYKLDKTFASGTYLISLRNIGNENEGGEYNFTNSNIVSASIKKLQPLENLNINDGLNLKWTDSNNTGIEKVLLNIVQYIDNEQTKFSGVVSAPGSTIKFEEIKYYVDNYNNNILVLATECTKEADGTLTYAGKEVKSFESNANFKLNVVAFGENSYINSDESNTITITRPDPVSNLTITNGKITWTGSSDANGYILSINRRDLTSADDSVYNENHALIYLQGKEYYNLTDVNYYYDVVIRAYALVSSEGGQTFASEERRCDNYLFDTFSTGNGTNEEPYIISSEDDLINIKYNNFATYSVKTDIVITKAINPLFNENNPFIGKLVGNGHIITNLNISENVTYSGLLGYMDEGTVVDDRVIDGVRTATSTNYVSEVENVQFDSAKITGGCYVGVVAGYSSGVISNITITYSQISSTSQILADVGASIKSVHSGSIVGVNYGIIKKCKVETATIDPTDKTKRYSGGICSENRGLIVGCETSATVYGNVSGGVCANNYGTIDFVKCYGNVVCENYLSANEDLLGAGGGISAYNNDGAIISNCLVRNIDFNSETNGVMDISQVTNTKTVYIGGLVGQNSKNAMCYNNCIEIKLLQQNNTISCGLGKIIGYNYNNEIYNNYCLFNSYTQASKLYDGVLALESNKEITEYDMEIHESLTNENQNSDYIWIINFSSDGKGTIDFSEK